MTDEFSVLTDGNGESFIHGAHTECSSITPINLNKTKVCQHHPSPRRHPAFLCIISKATSCILLWACCVFLFSEAFLYFSKKSMLPVTDPDGTSKSHGQGNWWPQPQRELQIHVQYRRKRMCAHDHHTPSVCGPSLKLVLHS